MRPIPLCGLGLGPPEPLLSFFSFSRRLCALLFHSHRDFGPKKKVNFQWPGSKETRIGRRREIGVIDRLIGVIDRLIGVIDSVG